MAALLSGDKSLENNLELLQQVALRNYLANGDESKQFYQLVTSLRVGNELYQRVSGQRKVKDHKAQCLGNIITFIKENPNASQDALKKEVQQQVALFAARVAST